ncbi:bifunctional diaminohydroxyphosphoribosylaminopyrimidine deaminase/5-amino-6-(5-phosphoribosylamino)uracil reductase RibD [Brevibacillus sp. SYP-B805]|uniref:bifunctional diaminohydroxyphosphoribosylaminopyrimidine deaminase/5-amino-6-(5-phosphoribosylamino)uracil reductase RibD n=1 Tax=Brevibacillus sp. SYP-B805 TaxID=1578199 RepID=UPI0013ECB351|nr:bifunctional diaminohydroxyphosphoribosylaminopyrimidine deaminase/5-amino-6-(5-phosphoribosylamino)uracil reductase RibD [Brevibacillus sp. SYP-B805]NGQ97411.1 bifunctional diaminohydroxyphosphoribosylaminopyrimidine deaminase/5-amino-6-(5-phosphoribosylamino)uracil reductase RibD [Brevibacillus sp. SYP-B805]
MLDAHYMSLAIQLAKGAIGQTSPNPLVGAVVVKDGEIVGMGAHLKAGEAHAEVHALRMAGEKARQATLYVTLEPCSHHGRTPPCCDAILQAGISRVVIATVDPNPLVAGRGIARLREAGLEVSVGLLEQEARRLNEAFFHFISTGTPFVTVKTASTLDGKVATETGHSRWVSGEKAREEVHLMRHRHDAILVGVNTVIADDPALTARLDGTARQPVRVILDTTLRIPLSAQVVTDGKAPTWIFTTRRAAREKREALQQHGVRIISDEERDHVDIHWVLRCLGEQGITTLLVEGGSAVNGAFLNARAIQKVISYLSLKLVGGASAPTPFGAAGIPTMDEAIPLKEVEVERISEHDLRISGYPDWKGGI